MRGMKKSWKIVETKQVNPLPPALHLSRMKSKSERHTVQKVLQTKNSHTEWRHPQFYHRERQWLLHGWFWPQGALCSLKILHHGTALGVWGWRLGDRSAPHGIEGETTEEDQFQMWQCSVDTLLCPSWPQGPPSVSDQGAGVGIRWVTQAACAVAFTITTRWRLTPIGSMLPVPEGSGGPIVWAQASLKVWSQDSFTILSL